jgi:predicted metalloprotease with PDZ domain
VPNSLALTGDYDWFFEGFTSYQALRAAVLLRLVGFQEYLDTLGRVYDSYLNEPGRDELSLIEASGRRWTTSSGLLYNKAMLVAFIYDLRSRSSSDTKLSLDDVYRKLFAAHPEERRDANEVIISMLEQPVGLNGFSDRYVKNPVKVDLPSLLSPYGINVIKTNSGTRLTVSGNLNKAGRKLLGSLGYKS